MRGVIRVGAGLLVAGAIATVGATPAAAEHLATNDLPSASYSIGSSLATVESDTTSWVADYPTKKPYVPPFGAGPLATSDASVSYGSPSEIMGSEVDYYRKAGPLTSDVSQSYKAGPLFVTVSSSYKGAELSVAFSDVF